MQKYCIEKHKKTSCCSLIGQKLIILAIWLVEQYCFGFVGKVKKKIGVNKRIPFDGRE